MPERRGDFGLGLHEVGQLLVRVGQPMPGGALLGRKLLRGNVRMAEPLAKLECQAEQRALQEKHLADQSWKCPPVLHLNEECSVVYPKDVQCIKSADTQWGLPLRNLYLSCRM